MAMSHRPNIIYIMRSVIWPALKEWLALKLRLRRPNHSQIEAFAWM